MSNLTSREMNAEDIPLISKYWTESDPDHMQRMGVDLNKLPKKEPLEEMLKQQLDLPVDKKRSFCTIWEVDGTAVGHCNTNPTHFGGHGYMHLHLWQNTTRQKGMGAELVKMSLAIFFDKLKLKKIFCEPYALNPAPNKTLEKVGFDLVKEYVTTPGPMNFEQPVKLWEMTKEKYDKLYA